MDSRRHFLQTYLPLLTTLGANQIFAQEIAWPSKPVKVIAPSAPGGSLDILARMFARGLGDKLGQSFVVENKTGSGGNIGFDATAKSKPDGYTFMIASDPLAVNYSLYNKLPYDPIRDFAPIIMIATLSQVLSINPKIPATNIGEFLALVKAKPNTISVGTSGNGAPGHLAIALLAQAGYPLIHIPYRGAGLAVADAAAGQIDATIVTLPATLSFIRQKQLKPLAVTSSKRSRFAMELPTIKEVIPSVMVDSWQAFFAPVGTSKPIIGKLNSELNLLLKSKEVIDSFESQAFESGGGSPEDLGKFLNDEITRWAPIIKMAGMKAD